MSLLTDIAVLDPRSARTRVQAERFALSRLIDLAEERVEALLLIEGTDAAIAETDAEVDRLLLSLRRLDAIERRISASTPTTTDKE
jgi:hypothetical protein